MPIVVAGLAALIVAIMALLVLYGLITLVKILTQPLAGIPVIGAVRSALINGIPKAIFFWSPWLKLASTSIATWFRSLWAHHSTTNAHAHNASNAIANRLGGAVHYTIPKAKETAIKWAGIQAYEAGINAVHAANAHTNAVWYHLQGNINAANVAREAEIKSVTGDINTIAHELTGRIGQVSSRLGTALDGLASSVDQALHALESADAAALGALRTGLLTDLKYIAGYAQTLGQTIGTYARTVAGAAETHAISWANASGAAAIAGLWPDVVNPADRALQGVQAEAPGVIDGAPPVPVVQPVTLAGALAAVATMAATATTFVDECGLGLCNNLSGLGNELSTLLGLFVEGAMLAFLAEAIANPTATANATWDVVGGLIDEGVALADALVHAA